MVEWELMKVNGIYSWVNLCFWKVGICCFWGTKGVCEFGEVRNQSRVNLAEKWKANSKPRPTDGRSP